MAVTVVSFRWLDILEKEFDKNFVDLDLLLGDLDAEEPDLVYTARQKLAGLSSCFAQLIHKSQTVFQNSAKIEAELVDLRAELINSKTRQEILEEESRSLVLQLHSLQLDRLPSNQNPEQYKEKIESALKLSPAKAPYSDDLNFKNNSEVKKLTNEVNQYKKENLILRNSILALHSEVYGARLAAKYLDKELAGRIQQLQLLGKEMRTDIRDKLWKQLESEILLQRHKTVIRACRNKTNYDFMSADSKLLTFNPTEKKSINKNMKFTSIGMQECHLDVANNDSNKLLPPEKEFENKCNQNDKSEEFPCNDDKMKAVDEYGCMIGERRTVIVKRNPGQGLGISITGGREHGVPILISELEIGGPAYECKNLFVGDAILKVNNISLENVSHFEAVKFLTNLDSTDVVLAVQYIATESDDENSLSEDLYGYRYRFFDAEVIDSSDALGLHPVHTTSAHTPTAPGTPEFVRDSKVWGHFHQTSDTRKLYPPDLKSMDCFKNLEKHSMTVSCKKSKNIKECCLIDIEPEPVKEKHSENENFNLLSGIKSDAPVVENNLKNNEEQETLKIDLFGYDFKTDLNIKDLICPSNEKEVDKNRNDNLLDVLLCDDKLDSPPVEEHSNCLDDSSKLNVKENDIDTNIESNDDLVNHKTSEKIEEPSEDSKENISTQLSSNLYLEYVDKTIFSGLDDHSILDNIVKSFSEDDTSNDYLDKSDDRHITSDSGLEIYYPSSSDVENNYLDKIKKNDSYLREDLCHPFNEDSPKKYIELKTLQQIFDRSFSSNLSSPRGSTSFDDDVLSTEQSDEKNGNHSDMIYRSKMYNDGYKLNYIQKPLKNVKKLTEGHQVDSLISNEKMESIHRKLSKNDLIIKNDPSYVKKCKRNVGDSTQKRNKINRKSKSMDSARRDSKSAEKRKVIKELDDPVKVNDTKAINKKEIYRISDHFDENLIEYNTNTKLNYEINLDPMSPHTSETTESVTSDINNKMLKKSDCVKGDGLDEMEETRNLSRKYGLKIPGKAIKPDSSKVLQCHFLSEKLVDMTNSPIKLIEGHFKHYKPGTEEKEKPKVLKAHRFDSLGDPDFGTPV